MTFTHCSHSAQPPGTCCRVRGRWDNRCGKPAAFVLEIFHVDKTRSRHPRCEACAREDVGVHPDFTVEPLGGAA